MRTNLPASFPVAVALSVLAGAASAGTWTVDDDGTRRAFHNMCRHRGMVMLGGSGTCRAIRCDYHAWRYGLDGSLRVVPQRADQFPDMDPDDLGLLPAAVAEWEGLVFACPDPDVAPLDEWMAGFPDAIGSIRPGLVPQVAMADIPAACNWKLFVENHIDVYHLWYLHALSLADFEHRRFEHRAQPRVRDVAGVDIADPRHRDLLLLT